MAGMLYDNKAAAQLEQAYATTDMIVQREELRRSLRASAGESILDLGSGPGFLACELAQEVGATGRIVAVDISSDMNSIASKRIAAAWNEHLPDPYLPRSLAPRLRAAGFEVREIRIVPILNTAYDATTFSYNIAPLIAAFVPGHGGVSEDEATEWLNDLAELQHQGRYFFSVNRYLFATSRPQGGGPRSATGL
jgi:SAM-dependent methyltransferase